jgi:hypothetical protein
LDQNDIQRISRQLRGLGRRRDACASLAEWWVPADRSGVTIRIRLSVRLAAGAVSDGGVDEAYDGWRFPSLNFSNGCRHPGSLRLPEVTH